MNRELVEAIRALEKERGIDAELLFSAVEEALVSACKREMGDKNRSIYAEIDRETGEISLDAHKTIVETVQDPGAEITIEDAYAVTQDDSLSIGDIVSFSVSHDRMGRLAAQTAKSIINQKLQQAEKERIQAEYQEKIGEVVQGIVQSSDRRETIVDIGRAEAVLLKREQSRLDSYDFGRRMKFLISGVSERRGRPVVYVSRSQAGLVAKLFEHEVPELGNGPIEIKSVVREAGSRTKMAVFSHDPDIDAVGSCVGQGGMRVQQVINELNGEKIDIIEWNEDPAVFVQNALSPAKVIRVNISRVEEAGCRVIVADNQLSLAIGKEGQNARLAAKLTKWKIDIKSESQYREILEQGLKAHLAREEAAASAASPDENTTVPEELLEERAEKSDAYGNSMEPAYASSFSSDLSVLPPSEADDGLDLEMLEQLDSYLKNQEDVMSLQDLEQSLENDAKTAIDIEGDDF